MNCDFCGQLLLDRMLVCPCGRLAYGKRLAARAREAGRKDEILYSVSYAADGVAGLVSRLRQSRVTRLAIDVDMADDRGNDALPPSAW